MHETEPLYRIVQGLWIGPKLSKIELACIQSYLKHGHQFHLYAYHPYENLPEGAILKDANEIILEKDIFTYEKGPGKGSYAAFANLFRYKLLVERGGWWSDMDFICLSPLPEPSKMFIAAEWKQKSSLWSGALRTRLTKLEFGGLDIPFLKNILNKRKPSNNLLFCRPGEKLMKRAYELAVASRNDELEWGQTGPDLMNRLLDQEGYSATTIIGDPRIFQPIGGYQIDLIFQPYSKVQFRQAKTLHLYNELWRRQGRSKTGPFPENSIVKRLIRETNVSK